MHSAATIFDITPRLATSGAVDRHGAVGWMLALQRGRACFGDTWCLARVLAGIKSRRRPSLRPAGADQADIGAQRIKFVVEWQVFR